MKKTIRLGILGLGRIGIMHAQNILAMPEFEVVMGADPFLTEEREKELLAMGIPACTRDPEDIFSHPDIDAVVICSTTDTHSEFIIRAARAGKDIFCEKPIDHDVGRILEAIRAVNEAKVILQVGFMHRFDRHHGALAEVLHSGQLGAVEVVKITSRDPAPPSMEYIRTSGGIFVDFMIHDFDMARFLTQSEAVGVFATGTTVCDPEIAEQGDFGSGHAIVKFANGTIAVLESTRRATFGHDQRIEALGSKGLVTDDNVYDSNIHVYNDECCYHTARIPWHFQGRYKEAYLVELQAFAKAVLERAESPVNGWDGLQAVLIAEAAARSAKSGKYELVETIEI
ncbi:MAG: inositol 2-dehydrogenase [Eubacteriales bacterium]|nr:inositol 2-dehydrogenase [Eubacteriales bacterium]